MRPKQGGGSPPMRVPTHYDISELHWAACNEARSHGAAGGKVGAVISPPKLSPSIFLQCNGIWQRSSSVCGNSIQTVLRFAQCLGTLNIDGACS